MPCSFYIPTDLSIKEMDGLHLITTLIRANSKTSYTRLDDGSLREESTLKGDATAEELPARLSTLQAWVRKRLSLSLPPMRRSKVPIEIEKMPSKTSGATAEIR